MADDKVARNSVDPVEAKIAADTSWGEITWTDEEEKRVRNKLDLQIVRNALSHAAGSPLNQPQVPMVTLLYLMCFLDRANIGNARIQGMEEDLNLVGYRFNWALSIFYIIYCLVEVPSNILLKKVGPRYASKHCFAPKLH